MQQEDKPIFRNYEIKNFDFSPLIYKLLSAAAIFNLIGIFVMAQAQIFTTRGCDSPMVSRVCEVIDTIYIGSMMLGTDRNDVDIPYKKTELENVDITYIDVSGQAPPFAYPADYFALANPESQFENMTNPSGISGIPGIPNSTTINPTLGNTDLSTIQPVTPSPNKNAVTGTIPTRPFEMGPNPIPNPIGGRTKSSGGFKSRKPKIRNDSPTSLTEFPADLTGEKKKDPTTEKPVEPKSDPVPEVEINKRPIKDLGIFVNTLLKDKNANFNLETKFEAKARGKLTKEGKLEKNTKIETTTEDPKMAEVIKQSIEAINDAGYLKYLKDLSGKDLNLILKQDEAGITAEVQSELESNTRANSLKGILNLAIRLSKSKKNPDAQTDPAEKQEDIDDLEILNGATVETDGKKLIIKFNIKKEIAQEMIRRKLLEEANKPQTNNTVQSDSLSRQVAK